MHCWMDGGGWRRRLGKRKSRWRRREENVDAGGGGWRRRMEKENGEGGWRRRMEEQDGGGCRMEEVVDGCEGGWWRSRITIRGGTGVESTKKAQNLYQCNVRFINFGFIKA